MTDFAQEKFALRQLSGALEIQQGSLQSSYTDENANNSNDRFIVLSKTKTHRLPNICLFINKSESRGFVHQSSFPAACKQRSLVNREVKNRRYFQLLKEYVNVALVTKRLKNELESLLEQCLENKQISCNDLWDLSKVLNILERYKADVQIIRGLEIKMKLFLKSEKPFLVHSVSINLQGIYKFLYTANNEFLYDIYKILQIEVINLHRFGSENLLEKDSQQKVNLKHFAQLATRFEKLAVEVYSDVNQWCYCWRDHTHRFVSKKGGIRNLCPFLYLKPSPLPHRLNHLWNMITSMSVSQYLEKVAVERAINVSKEVMISLFNLILMEEYNYNGITHNTQDEKDTSRNSKKRAPSFRKTKISLKKSRNIIHQELWKSGSQELPILLEIVNDMFHFHTNAFQKSSNFSTVDQLTNKSQQSEMITNSSSFSHKKSSNFAKKVHWDSSKDSKIQNEILNNYVESLWKYSEERFIRNILFGNINRERSSEKWDMPLLCMSTEKMSVTASLLCVKKLTSLSGEIHPAFVQCVKEISSDVSYYFALQKWDSAMCSVQTKALKDKCRITTDASLKHSETMGFILETLNVIQDMMELVTSNSKYSSSSTLNESGNKKNLILLNCLLAFSSTLQRSMDWLQAKSQQFISSGSWQQFHLITNNDASTLQERLRSIIPNFATLAKLIHSTECSDGFIIQALGDIQSILGNIKNFNVNKIDALAQAIKCRSESSYKQHFPAAKQWRKRGATRLPVDSNLYMKLAAHQVLAPVIESVKHISQEDADEILFKCFSVFVISLMDYILQEEIKFSFFGAHQLRLDFACLKEWIAQDTLDIPNETVQKIFNLASFFDMESAITLLCCQPEHRRRRSNGNDIENGSSLVSSSSQGSFSGSLFEDTIRDIDLRTKEQWLSLRVKGGQNKSKLLCIS